MLKNSLRGLIMALPLLLLTLLCTCDRAQKQTVTTRVNGTIRYQEDISLLETTLNMEPVDSSASAVFPTLFGTAIPPLATATPGTFRARRNLAFPSTLQLTVPCPTGPNCSLTYEFSPVFSDSLPTVLDKNNTLRFAFGKTNLAENESLVLFFEPQDRSMPRRLQLMGPSKSNYLTVRKEGLVDIPPGAYDVYLIKQGLFRSSSLDVEASIQTEYFTKTKSVEVR